MSAPSRIYIAIDLKSFYASAECASRGLDPLTTNLVVADKSRTEKTICLAVSPSMKQYGIGGRARLFEVVQRVRQVNAERLMAAAAAKGQTLGAMRFTGKSVSDTDLKEHPDWELDYIVAKPRMAYYIKVSTAVYKTYLKYVAAEDIHVYSIDEVFMDVTDYLATYKMTPHELAMCMIRDVLSTTGITATAGIGTNMYLAKVAMDIVAKRMPADKDGVRIAELDETTYRRTLWNHQPLSAFWRVGRGIAHRLAQYGITTMGQIARKSLHDEDFFYRMFGINAELLIDHAWGWEPCTMQHVKAYRPEASSLSSGQVLQRPYEWAQARVVVREMADALALELVARQLVTDQLSLGIGYDTESLTDTARRARYTGPVGIDHYGRVVPKHANGTEHLASPTSSSAIIMDAMMRLYDRIASTDLLIRRITIGAYRVAAASLLKNAHSATQLDLFTDYAAQDQIRNAEKQARDKEHRLQRAQLSIKARYGKNAILRGMSYTEGATARERNTQIGGHKA